MEPKDQAIPITLCKARNTSLTKSFIWVVGVEMSNKRLSTFYFLQNLEGESLLESDLPYYTFGGAACLSSRAPEAFAREITPTTLEGLFS